jgi:hypothetical protein
MRLSRMAAGAAVVLATALSVSATASTATASAATAGAAAAGNAAWQPYRTAPWTDAPGAVCSFGVAATPVNDQEQYRTLASYPDGDPRLQEFRGPLFVQYTNMSTGASVVRDLSGYGWFHYGADGSIDIHVASHIGLTVDVGNAGFPAGEWVISGPSEVTVSSSGAIGIRLIDATAENLCQTLS